MTLNNKILRHLYAILALLCCTVPGYALDRVLGSFVFSQKDIEQLRPGETCERRIEANSLGRIYRADEPAKDFRVAACQLHQKVVPKREPPLSDDAWYDIQLDVWAEMQRSGLPGVQQVFAEIAEGLLHCGIAAEWQAKLQTSELATARFCASRRRALTSLANIRWDMAQFDYETKTNAQGQTLTGLLNKLSMCRVSSPELNVFGPLAPEYENRCRFSDEVTHQRLDEIVSEVGKDLKNVGGSRLTAMFTRVKTLSDPILDYGKDASKELLKDEKILKTVHEALLNSYENDDIEPHLDKATVALVRHPQQCEQGSATNEDDKITVDSSLNALLNTYKCAYSKAQSILDTKSRWEGGLLIDKAAVPEHNLRHDIFGPSPSNRYGTEGVLGQLDKRLEVVRTQNGNIQKLIADIKKLRNREERDKRRTRQLCVHFYCDVAVSGSQSIGDFTWNGFDIACRSPGLADSNPLCRKLPSGIYFSEQMKEENSVMKLCTEAGMDVNFTRLGLNAIEAKQCREGSGRIVESKGDENADS
jgi:hypothetical protein